MELRLHPLKGTRGGLDNHKLNVKTSAKKEGSTYTDCATVEEFWNFVRRSKWERRAGKRGAKDS